MSNHSHPSKSGSASRNEFDTAGPFDAGQTKVALATMQSSTDQEQPRMVSVSDPLFGREGTERGASMVEYALLVILIAIVAFVAVRIAGENVSMAFSTVADGFVNPN